MSWGFLLLLRAVALRQRRSDDSIDGVTIGYAVNKNFAQYPMICWNSVKETTLTVGKGRLFKTLK
jgi:hypothetical protein